MLSSLLALSISHHRIDKFVRIGSIVLVAVVLHVIVNQAIKRFIVRLLAASSRRAAQRAATLSLALRGLTTAVIWIMAVLSVLGEVGINLGPLLAGAGIVGVAIGFGAQTLVRDFLSGVFMLIEDQYGVGDNIDIGVASGVVEHLSLRTTRVRDADGTLWHVSNGQIVRVGNKSQP